MVCGQPRRCQDTDDAPRFLKLFTFLSIEEIAALETEMEADPGARTAQRTLAQEATRIVHGNDGLASALRATEVLFGDEPFVGLDAVTLTDAFREAPSASLPRERLTDGIGILETMVVCGAAGSNGEARRLIDQGGVRLNNTPVTNPTDTLSRDDLLDGSMVVIRVGKKRYHLARFV